jgi:valyl-tRNA synthetase
LDAHARPRYDQPILPDLSRLPVDPLAQAAPGFDEAARGKPNGFIGDPDVMDTWATSSLTPQIASHWADDPERHSKLFPMDIPATEP